MADPREGGRDHLGPYRLVRSLGRCALGERWLALEERTQSSHVCYDFGATRDGLERRRFLEVVEALSKLDHPHVLKIERYSFAAGGHAWIVTPYTGSHDGLVTIDTVAAAKGGRMNPPEAERAVRHLLEASHHAFGAGIQHGPITTGEVLVDRHGSVAVELYGLRGWLGGHGLSLAELQREEVRSIAEIAYRLITGFDADEPLIAASKLAPRLNRRWDDWFEVGLDPREGFASAGEALAKLPSIGRVAEPVAGEGTVRTFLGRLTGRGAVRRAD